jgi:NTP pyrophosphatase (non-canonical NTP hydrolase)
MTNGDRLAIVVEEIGEVARAMTYDQDPLNLERELIQVAAMVAMWIDGLSPRSRRMEEAGTAATEVTTTREDTR